MKKFQRAVKNFSTTKGFNSEPIERKFLLFSEEVGELAKAVRKHIGMKIGKHSQDPKTGEEAADVLFMFLDICNTLDIDLEQEFRKKFETYKKRI